MDERIKAHAERVGFFFSGIAGGDFIEGSATQLDEFAKLIVQDCFEVISSADALCGSGVPDRVLLDLVRRNVEGYFGIK